MKPLLLQKFLYPPPIPSRVAHSKETLYPANILDRFGIYLANFKSNRDKKTNAPTPEDFMIRFTITFLAIYLSASVCLATDLWQDIETNTIFTLTTERIDSRVDEIKQATVNLDRTLFGRARNHNDIDIAAQVKNAWAQGYTGQGVSIAILDYMGPSARATEVTLNGVNTNPSRIWDMNFAISYRHPTNPEASRTSHYRIQLQRSTTNNGSFSGSYKHWEKGAFIIGGRHKDADGTVLYGIAKDANLTFLDANNRNRVQQLTAQPFHFINASFRSIAPSSRMTTLYQGLDATNAYEHGKLPVYITSGGNITHSSGTASYQGLLEGRQSIADYNAVDMAMSDTVIDGRPLSDYLLIAGAFNNRGNGIYDNIANRPGEVVELQNRWLSAPYTFTHDAGALYGTSYAAPFITGIAGIVKSKFPELAPADVANVLLETAKDIGAPGTDAVFGRGLVDLENALSPQ